MPTESNINKSYQWAIQTCNAPNVGYSMTYRNQQTVNGITYYDCSSFIWFALKAGGFDVVTAQGGSSYPMTTYNEESVLSNLGFNRLSNISNIEWLPGDIVIREQHTEMVYRTGTQNGYAYTMGAITASGAIENQVRIRTEESNNWLQVWRYGQGGATGYGLTVAQVAAMCGNAWAESTVNPGASGEGYVPQDHAYGLWAWTDWTGENPFYLGTQMKEWVEARYDTWTNGDGQVDCVLTDDLPNGSVWTQTSIPEYAYTNSLYPDMQSWIDSDDKDDVEEMCREWFLHWESPTSLYWFNYTWNQRLSFALLAYDYIMEHANDEEITDWIVDTQHIFLNQQQALNNCVMIYRFASAGGGGGGKPTKKKGMPLWMKLRYF